MKVSTFFSLFLTMFSKDCFFRVVETQDCLVKQHSGQCLYRKLSPLLTTLTYVWTQCPNSVHCPHFIKVIDVQSLSSAGVNTLHAQHTSESSSSESSVSSATALACLQMPKVPGWGSVKIFSDFGFFL